MDFNESTILLDVAVASKEELFEVIANYAYELGLVANARPAKLLSNVKQNIRLACRMALQSRMRKRKPF